MCRIFGWLGPDPDPGSLHKIAGRLRHGGPDDLGITSGPGWGVGATRLAIMDPDGGRQPYRLGQIHVVFNGEIYNHAQLRRELDRAGYPGHDRCDGSVLAPLYHLYGASFVEHLDGMYAIAIADLRGQPELLLATDPYGIKPLYYTTTRDGGLAFASELPALTAFPQVDTSIWDGALDAYLTTKAIFGSRTNYTQVSVAEPGTLLRYRPSHRLSTSRGGTRLGRRPAEADITAAGETVLETLRREVRRLAQADVPVAAICSGGLDSSLVTTLLAELPGQVSAFHIGYGPGWPASELGYARAVADRCGAQLHEVELQPQHIPGLLPATLAHLGQPNADPIAVSTLALFQAVSSAGFRAAITGDAADEFFAGYDRIKAALQNPGDWIADYVDSLAAVPPALRDALYTDEYQAELRRHSTRQELISSLRSEPGSRLSRITKLEVEQRLPAYHLRRVDHLSMASAVEVRVPFCQPSVAALALALPERLRVRDDQGKRALYQAAAGLLPPQVLSRPKQPFTLPVLAMLQAGGPLLDYAKEVLAADEVRPGGQLDPLAVTGLIATHERRPTGATAAALWALLIYQLWYRGAHHETSNYCVR